MIPNEWFRLIKSYDYNGKSRKLDANDVIILAMINSLEKNGLDCYISNDYIGSKIGLKFTAVRERIAFLSYLGFISRETTFDGISRTRLMSCNTDYINSLLNSSSGAWTPNIKLEFIYY